MVFETEIIGVLKATSSALSKINIVGVVGLDCSLHNATMLFLSKDADETSAF
jgi:hypothetical protein